METENGRILGENIEIHQSGPLLALRQRNDYESRQANGDLEKPPILLVVIDDGESGNIRFERVSWRLAETLVPLHHTRLVHQMSTARTIEDKATTWLKAATPDELAELAKLVAKRRP